MTQPPPEPQSKSQPQTGGERDLERLLTDMAPVLDPVPYVYATLAAGVPPPSGVAPIMTFHEAEGLTLVLPRADAEAAGLAHTFPCRRITLTVHSALEAVGFLAVVTTRLAAAGISTNAVAAYHHDHLFVPAADAERAMRVLAEAP